MSTQPDPNASIERLLGLPVPTYYPGMPPVPHVRMPVAPIAERHAKVLAPYTEAERTAAADLYFQAMQYMAEAAHPVAGAICTRVLLGLYDSYRFPLALKTLTHLSKDTAESAITTIRAITRTEGDIAALIDAILELPQGSPTTHVAFANWARRLKAGKK